MFSHPSCGLASEAGGSDWHRLKGMTAVSEGHMLGASVGVVFMKTAPGYTGLIRIDAAHVHCHPRRSS
jgi:hypothetical protein